MTILECITQIDTLKPNVYTMRQKIDWLNELDGKIKQDVVNTHEGSCCDAFSPYTERDDGAELIAQAPHDVIYILWIKMKIESWDKDIRSYNNTLQDFQDAYQDFANWYNRTHMPKQSKIIYW